jgi:hypothetical protein
VAKVTVPNNAPETKIEEMLSVRCGTQVQFGKGRSLVWLPNKRYEFVSIIPGQKSLVWVPPPATPHPARRPKQPRV